MESSLPAQAIKNQPSNDKCSILAGTLTNVMNRHRGAKQKKDHDKCTEKACEKGNRNIEKFE